ncbi:MAG TPA: hypothetical protein VFI06_14405 [Chitinophagaceae bacterium]|nr:hypothetical protein [Chitinophagaceae bacterium]
MKGTLMIVLVTAFGAFFSCKKNQTADDGALRIKLYSCASPIVSGTQVQLCFDSLLMDSRCPCNADCIWRGIAAGKFSFSVDGQTHRLRLAEFAVWPFLFPKDTTVAGYKIEFVDLTPYPCMPENADRTEKAEMKITKL